jgi:hypothetical protein
LYATNCNTNSSATQKHTHSRLRENTVFSVDTGWACLAVKTRLAVGTRLSRSTWIDPKKANAHKPQFV